MKGVMKANKNGTTLYWVETTINGQCRYTGVFRIEAEAALVADLFVYFIENKTQPEDYNYGKPIDCNELTEIGNYIRNLVQQSFTAQHDNNISTSSKDNLTKLFRAYAALRTDINFSHTTEPKQAKAQEQATKVPQKSPVRSISSQYFGVSCDNIRKCWKATIQIKKQRIFLGRFDYEEDAALAFLNKKLELIAAGQISNSQLDNTNKQISEIKAKIAKQPKTKFPENLISDTNMQHIKNYLPLNDETTDALLKNFDYEKLDQHDLDFLSFDTIENNSIEEESLQELLDTSKQLLFSEEAPDFPPANFSDPDINLYEAYISYNDLDTPSSPPPSPLASKRSLTEGNTKHTKKGKFS